jgi:hypothetical protein
MTASDDGIVEYDVVPLEQTSFSAGVALLGLGAHD